MYSNSNERYIIFKAQTKCRKISEDHFKLFLHSSQLFFICQLDQCTLTARNFNAYHLKCKQKNILRLFKTQVYVILINRVVYKEPIKSIKKVIYTILNVTLMKFFHLCKCLSYLIFSFLAIHCERKQSQCLLSDGLCKTAKSKHQ